MAAGAVTASMLYDLTSCAHRVHLDLFGDRSRREKASAFVEMLWREGALHEARQLASPPPGTADLREAPAHLRQELTAAAMAAGAPLILGAEIATDGLLARPDLLRREGRDYVPGDIKAGVAVDAKGRPKHAYANQVALAADILIRSGALSGRRGFVVDRSGAEVAYDLDTPLGVRSGSAWSAYEAALGLASAIVSGQAATRPAACAACKLCVWRGHCREALVAGDDVTLVPHLGPRMRAAFEPHARTVAELASLPIGGDSEVVVKGIGRERLARFRDRARLLSSPGASAYARSVLPLARAERELFLDIEVDPFGDRTYLHGILERTRSGPGRETERFHAHLMTDDGEGEERRAFSDAFKQLTADPDARIYYWSPYERTLYRALQARYPDVCSADEVEALFGRPETIDLLNDIVNPMTDWPLHDHSIKTIAKHLGFRWRDAEPSGAASIEWYRRWLASGDEAIRRRIVEYNEDDCIATRVVLDGLLALPVRAPGERA
jgi:predicted RecB family nuclease